MAGKLQHSTAQQGVAERTIQSMEISPTETDRNTFRLRFWCGALLGGGGAAGVADRPAAAASAGRAGNRSTGHESHYGRRQPPGAAKPEARGLLGQMSHACSRL